MDAISYSNGDNSLTRDSQKRFHKGRFLHSETTTRFECSKSYIKIRFISRTTSGS